MKKPTIKSNCRHLVENILNENVIDANDLLKKILLDIQNKREEKIEKIVLEAEDEDDVPADADTDLTDADIEAEDEDGEDNGEPGLGDDLGAVVTDKGDEERLNAEEGEGAEDEEEEPIGDAALAEMGNDMTELQCEINEKMISIYADKLANLKTELNAKGLNKHERDYVTFEMEISYYSKKLRELQDKCEITVDQDEVKSRLDIIEKAIKTIASQISSGDVPDVKATFELEDDINDEEAAAKDKDGEEEPEAAEDESLDDELGEKGGEEETEEGEEGKEGEESEETEENNSQNR